MNMPRRDPDLPDNRGGASITNPATFEDPLDPRTFERADEE